MYSMDGRTFNTIEELYAYQREAHPYTEATEENWGAFDPALAAQFGISEPDWNALVGQINGMRQGETGPIPYGPQGPRTDPGVNPTGTIRGAAELSLQAS
jgi:hypothetical protein